MMPKHFKKLFVLSIPIILKYLFLLVYVDLYLVSYEDVVEDVSFVMSIVLLLQIPFLKGQLIRAVIFFLYIFYFMLETTSYMAVASNFSSSYMYLLIESNKQELSEFSSAYVTVPIVVYFVLSIITFFVIRKLRLTIFKKNTFWYSVFGFIGIVVALKVSGYIERNAYHNIVRGTYGYFKLQNNYKFNSNIKKEDVKINSNNEVFVVVLGESTWRGHMQLYGYKRETTPLLNSIKNDLLIYENVISTDVLTLKAVPKMLSSYNDNLKNEEAYNIVEVFNAAGFDTYWLSNQRPISYHDNAINKIASASKWFKFYNHTDDLYTTVVDEIVFTDYLRILKKPGKKLIFIKLIGSHFEYKNRYPSSYEMFKGGKSKKEKLINQYDNTVLYNDYVVHSLIKKLEAHSNKSALLYLSDHGENVYDNGTDFFGRAEENLTSTMFEIPFLLWTSKDFTFPNDFEFVPKRKFMADHTYESLGHVFGVLHNKMNATNSIFSSHFKERKRMVVNQIDFDTYFVKKNE